MAKKRKVPTEKNESCVQDNTSMVVDYCIKKKKKSSTIKTRKRTKLVQLKSPKKQEVCSKEDEHLTVHSTNSSQVDVPNAGSAISRSGHVPPAFDVASNAFCIPGTPILQSAVDHPTVPVPGMIAPYLSSLIQPPTKREEQEHQSFDMAAASKLSWPFFMPPYGQFTLPQMSPYLPYNPVSFPQMDFFSYQGMAFPQEEISPKTISCNNSVQERTNIVDSNIHSAESIDKPRKKSIPGKVRVKTVEKDKLTIDQKKTRSRCRSRKCVGQEKNNTNKQDSYSVMDKIDVGSKVQDGDEMVAFNSFELPKQKSKNLRWNKVGKKSNSSSEKTPENISSKPCELAKPLNRKVLRNATEKKESWTDSKKRIPKNKGKNKKGIQGANSQTDGIVTGTTLIEKEYDAKDISEVEHGHSYSEFYVAEPVGMAVQRSTPDDVLKCLSQNNSSANVLSRKQPCLPQNNNSQKDPYPKRTLRSGKVVSMYSRRKANTKKQRVLKITKPFKNIANIKETLCHTSKECMASTVVNSNFHKSKKVLQDVHVQLSRTSVYPNFIHSSSETSLDINSSGDQDILSDSGNLPDFVATDLHTYRSDDKNSDGFEVTTFRSEKKSTEDVTITPSGALDLVAPDLHLTTIEEESSDDFEVPSSSSEVSSTKHVVLKVSDDEMTSTDSGKTSESVAQQLQSSGSDEGNSDGLEVANSPADVESSKDLYTKSSKASKFGLESDDEGEGMENILHRNNNITKCIQELRKGKNTGKSGIQMSDVDVKLQDFQGELLKYIQELEAETDDNSERPRSVLPESGFKQEMSIGSVVWAKLGREKWWPGLIIMASMVGMKPEYGYQWVFWFGDHKISKIALEKIVPFVPTYQEKLSKNASSGIFRRALLEAVKECAMRGGVEDDLEDDEALLKWAKDSFMLDSKYLLLHPNPFSPHTDFPIPPNVMKYLEAIRNDNEESEVEVTCRRSGKKESESAIIEVRKGFLKIQEVCIGCDDISCSITHQHPLFDGGLCKGCKDSLTESLFAFGEDGTGVYCCVCSGGGELFVCDSEDCNRAYCTMCIGLYLSEAALKQIRAKSPWLCFLCTPYTSTGTTHGYLKPKKDWQKNLVIFYDTGYRIEKPNLSYLSTENPKPIRVLSLFDGIGTGKLVLDELGIEAEVFFSSEIDEDAILVTAVHHGSSVQQIGDIRNLDEAQLKKLCPIDLVIGGSPCNDFSLVNYARKGFDGTGILFFYFYDVLKTIQNLCRDRHVFWLYENVASMKLQYKNVISSFLRCEPAIWDAKYFTPQRRVRYFWGNIPGMYSTPVTAQRGFDVSLGSSLFPNCNRKPTVQHLHCVRSGSRSLLQGKNEDIFPVSMNGKEDSIWISELEGIFGFPAHYTDVGNLPQTRRQGLLARAWSVPVIKHLLKPLQQYFKSTSSDEDE